jgi:hypothetical protein
MSESLPRVRRRRWPVFVPLAIVIVLAGIWSVIWYSAARVAEDGIARWIDQEGRNGRVYTCASRKLSGYPFRIEVRCTEPVADIKSASLILKAKELLAVAQVYQPNLIIGEITGPLTIGAPDQPPIAISEWTLAQASLRLNPMPVRVSIVLDGAKFNQPPPNAGQSAPPQTIATADHIEMHVRLNPASSPDNTVLDLIASVKNAAAPSVGALAAKPVDADVTALLHGVNDFRPKPLPVRLREWQAAGGRLEITNIRIRQGDAVAVAKGDLGLSPNGRLEGTLGVTLAGFDQFLQAMLGSQGKNTGLLAVAGLSLLGKPADLEGKRAIAVPLRFKDGAVSFGPIPLGKTAPLY